MDAAFFSTDPSPVVQAERSGEASAAMRFVIWREAGGGRKSLKGKYIRTLKYNIAEVEDIEVQYRFMSALKYNNQLPTVG